ncbi:MAG: hypothetical protein HQL54_13710 [Magnetococcales bacterium]|nr:hypothetical protein [Magnetococcales bacterium]
MNITLEIPDDVGQRAKQELSNINEIATDAFRQALEQRHSQSRPLTELEKKFIDQAIERADRGEGLNEEEVRAYFRGEGVDC